MLRNSTSHFWENKLALPKLIFSSVYSNRASNLHVCCDQSVILIIGRPPTSAEVEGKYQSNRYQSNLPQHSQSGAGWTDDAAADVMLNWDTPYDSHLLQSEMTSKRLTNGYVLVCCWYSNTLRYEYSLRHSPGWLLADATDKNKPVLGVEMSNPFKAIAFQYFKLFQFSFDKAPQHLSLCLRRSAGGGESLVKAVVADAT